MASFQISLKFHLCPPYKQVSGTSDQNWMSYADDKSDQNWMSYAGDKVKQRLFSAIKGM